MTTEIAVMNKSGIALAADSAVTVASHTPKGRKIKIFNTANKLFALSKHAPVGVMPYGNATLMGIPWETIIKCYRQSLDRKKFDTVKGYCDNFFHFLGKFNVGEDAEKNHIHSIAASLTLDIKNKLENQVKQTIKDKGNIAETEIESIFQNLIKEDNKLFTPLAEKTPLTKTSLAKLKKKHSQEINDIIAQVLQGLPLKQYYKNMLLKNIYTAISIPRMHQSGIVVAGFGETEIFPSCYEYNIDAIISGKVLKEDGRGNRITSDNSATIVPFAQADEVAAFMEGVGDKIKRLTDKILPKIMTSTLSGRIVEVVSGELALDDKIKTRIGKAIQKVGQGAYDEFNNVLQETKQKYYVGPVIEAVKFLNKEELAQMAETLVNLVSFRKQVTLEEETVGGPIDVAIITKGDGLIWMNRKHYFNKELNPHFFGKYFDSGDDKNG